MAELRDGWTEGQFQSAVLNMAKASGWLSYHTRFSMMSQAGFPDLVLVRGERLVFAELKRKKGRISAAQSEWFDALRRTKAEAYIWFPADWDEIERVLAPGAGMRHEA